MIPNNVKRASSETLCTPCGIETCNGECKRMLCDTCKNVCGNDGVSVFRCESCRPVFLEVASGSSVQGGASLEEGEERPTKRTKRN